MALRDFFRGLRGERQPARPFSEQGKGGFAVSGGVILSPESNPELMGVNRFKTASDLLANVSIIAASVRYSLNLVARPLWKVEPASDKAEAKAAAEFMEQVLYETGTAWSRVVRRSAMYRFHGFGINEWVAKRRDDGRIGIGSIESRPQHTIERWDIDLNGGVIGVWQRDPDTSREIYLPRQKLIYLVDDSLTDRPDGIGWFRHLADPARRLKAYLNLEKIGFQRDLTGTPVGRAPLHKINALVAAGDITQAQATEMIEGIKQFCRLETKNERTGLVLDSQTYHAKTDTGETISDVFEWGIELLKGDQSSIEALAAAIKRLEFEMASIMGTASMLTGREGEGSRALSEDQSRNLYLTTNATLTDMAEAYDRDIVGPIWAMNGLPDDLRPTLKTEDSAFKDAEQVARVLRDMASAGAILAPDDPAINDVRDLLGISEAKEMSPEELALMRGDPRDLDEDEDDLDDDEGGGKPRPSRGQGRAHKYDPNQPRDPGGEDGGQWVKAGGGSSDVLFEVAPDPNDAETTARWNSLSDEAKAEISQQIAEELTPEVLAELKAEGRLEMMIGGYMGETNPSLALALKGTDAALPAAALLGHSLSQDSMMVLSSEPHEGFEEVGVVAVKIPAGQQNLGSLGEIYSDLYTLKGDDGEPLVGGFAFRHGRMEILNFTGLSDSDLADKVNDHLGDKYGVMTGKAHASFLGKDSYAAHSVGGATARGGQRGIADRLRSQASERVEALVAERLENPRKGLSFDKRFNPNQPRDPAGTPTGGRWTSAYGVVPLTPDLKAGLVAANEGKTVEQIREEAVENQNALRELGQEIEKQVDVEFVEPPPGYEVKTVESLNRKITEEGYAGAHQITDISRATIVVDSPEEADQAIAILADRGKIYDKGWKRLEQYGYLDRKVYLSHPNGGLSEIQMVPKGVQQLKMSQGHKLYEIARKRSTPMSVLRAAARKSRTMYSKAIRGSPFYEVAGGG